MALATQPTGNNYLQRAPSPSGLVELVDLILDKGLVIDVYVRVSLVGIELITIDARIVVASVDTYLRFAEAVNRLDLTQSGDSETLPELFGDLEEGGAKRKTKGLLEGAKEKFFGDEDEGDEEEPDEDEDEEDEEEERPQRRSSGPRQRSAVERRRASRSRRREPARS